MIENRPANGAPRSGAGALLAALALSLVPCGAALAGQGTLVVLNKSDATASLIDLDSAKIAATGAAALAGPREPIARSAGSTTASSLRSRAAIWTAASRPCFGVRGGPWRPSGGCCRHTQA